MSTLSYSTKFVFTGCSIKSCAIVLPSCNLTFSPEMLKTRSSTSLGLSGADVINVSFSPNTKYRHLATSFDLPIRAVRFSGIKKARPRFRETRL